MTPLDYYGSAKDSGSLSDSSGSSSAVSPFGILTIVFESTLGRLLNIGVRFLDVTVGQGYPGSAYLTHTAEVGTSWFIQTVTVDLDQAYRDGFIPGSTEVGIIADWGDSQTSGYATFTASHSLDPFPIQQMLDPGDENSVTYHGRIVVTPLPLMWWDPLP